MKKSTLCQFFGALCLLVLSISLTSCYTVIKRPESALNVEGSYLEQDDGSEQVGRSEYIWYDPFYDWYYPGTYGRWRYYYTYPWWWNDYWYWHPSSDAPGADIDTDRYIWDRRRSPNWISPPSSSSVPSDASQPARKVNEGEEKRSAESSSNGQTRRRPDWNQKHDDRNSSDLESRQRDQQGEEDQEQSE